MAITVIKSLRYSPIRLEGVDSLLDLCSRGVGEHGLAARL